MSSDVRLSIHSYFREFGHDVGEAVYNELSKPGGLPRLLKRLRLPIEEDSTQQYRTLLQYFRRHGVEHFLELVGAKPLNFKIDVVHGPGTDENARARIGLRPLSHDQILTKDDTGDRSKIVEKRRLLDSQSEVRRPDDGTDGGEAYRHAVLEAQKRKEAQKRTIQEQETQKLLDESTTQQVDLEKTRKLDRPKEITPIPVSRIVPVSPKALKLSDPQPKPPAKQHAPSSAKVRLKPDETQWTTTPPEPPKSDTNPGLQESPATATPEPPVAKPADEEFPKGPLVAAPAPEPGTYDEKTPSWDSAKPRDPMGVWPDVERRSGKERRRKPDRRKDVDIVYQNKRYGGDRRQSGERRKNWPKGGHIK